MSRRGGRFVPRKAAADTSLRFSLVAAAYNVGRYLPEFIASIERQSFDLDRVEVILVDDGSTDDTGRRLADWQARHPSLVTVLSQPNAGQASARNLGISVASGEWVTFVDPDDFVDGNYLKRVDRFLTTHPETEMVATLRLLYWEDRGEMTHHALWRFFAEGDRVLNLVDDPQYFHSSAAAAFFKLQRIQDQGLDFDPNVGPHFEDGHFCAHYLLLSPQPVVGFVQSAKYVYRRRADSSSTTQISMSQAARFTDLPEHGYLEVLRDAQTRLGHAPGWLQRQILFDIRWFLKAASEPGHSTIAAEGPVADRFMMLMGEVLTYIDPDVISSFDAQPLTPAWRDILLHSFADAPWNEAYAVITDSDPGTELARVEYRYTGSPPDEDFVLNGEPARPAYAKRRSIEMFDHTLLHERIVWLPTAGDLVLRLDGDPIPILPDWPTASYQSPKKPELPTIAWRLPPFASGRRSLHAVAKGAGWARSRRRDLYKLAAGSVVAKSRYGEAWVLDDGPRGVMRSAEDLFEYLRAQRNDINSWFVTERDSPAWSRLNAEGQESHVVAHGSKQWQLLMLNCAVLISSDPDPLAHRPREILKFQDPQWKSVFLPATVIQDDISRSLNPKQADLVVTSTPDEFNSIVQDGTGYRYTAKETSLAGLPRFDRLRRLGQQTTPEQQDLVLVNPYLGGGFLESSNTRIQQDPGFAELWFADYRAAWLTFLRSDRLERSIRDRSLTLVFIPDRDPWLQEGEELPEHVRPLDLSENDPAALMARAAVFVTDYSPLASDAAYLDRPVVYAQMTEGRFAPTSTGKDDTYDYEKQGWGTVAYLASDAVAAVESALVSAAPTDQYAERIAQAFPYRGDSTSERVISTIEDMTGTCADRLP